MTELSFLVELLLNHRLAKPTQKAVKDRIAEVEQGLRAAPVPIQQVQQPSTFSTRAIASRPGPNDQPESTRKLLEKHGLVPKGITQDPPSEPIGIPEPEVHGINTQAVAGALAARNQMIMEGIAGPKKGSLASPKAHGTPRG